MPVGLYLTTVKSWSKGSQTKAAITCPSGITAYNDHTGGTDLSEMLVTFTRHQISQGDGTFLCLDTFLMYALLILGSFIEGTVAYWKKKQRL